MRSGIQNCSGGHVKRAEIWDPLQAGVCMHSIPCDLADRHRRCSLCRSKLRAEGWHVPEAVSTVPIPGVNMPKDADYRTYGMTAASS